MIRIAAAVAWTGLVVMCALLASPARAVVAKRVSGNLVFWDQARGFDSIVANGDVFSEITHSTTGTRRAGASGGDCLDKQIARSPE